MPIDHNLFGLQFARSSDEGKTWRTAHVVQKDPEGRSFDNYYNTMNGQFVQTGLREWVYLFGQFDVKHNVHRVLSLQVNADQAK